MTIVNDQAIYETLIASTASGSVHDLTSGRISANYGDPGEDYPLVVFEQIGSEAVEVFNHDRLMIDENYEIRAVGRYEAGITALATIGDAIVTAIHGTTATVGSISVTLDVFGGTEVSRADELFIASVQVRARHMQTSEL